MMAEERSRLDVGQVRRAVDALLKHIGSSASRKPNLMEDDGDVILAQVSLHKIPGKVSAKPIRIPIPHPLRQRDDCDMCLFIKDTAKKAMKEKLEKEPIEGLAKIIELQKLRTQYHQFKERRALLAQYDLFLCDDRILPMLTKVLGKTFLNVKKQPVPIRLDQKTTLASQIARARDSAFLVGSYGDCWAAKLAHTAMSPVEVTANLMAGIAAVVDNIPKKWKNVKAINIKCSDSIALPVYSNVGDLPPTPPAAALTSTSAEEKVDGEGGESREGGAKARGKTRKPRPLIRQQLNRLKEEAKAEKAAANATEKPAVAASKKGKGGRGNTAGIAGGEGADSPKSPAGNLAIAEAKRKREGAGENVEPVVAFVKKGGEEKAASKAERRKSPIPTVGKRNVAAKKAAKRRRTEVA